MLSIFKYPLKGGFSLTAKKTLKYEKTKATTTTTKSQVKY